MLIHAHTTSRNNFRKLAECKGCKITEPMIAALFLLLTFYKLGP